MERSHDAWAADANGPVHAPVLALEVVRALGGERASEVAGWIVDATVGAGGHAALLLAALPRVRVLGLDRDAEILAHAERKLAPFGARARLRHARMSQISRVLDEECIARVAGWLIDQGASSLQLDLASRGFSFQVDGPLDMRMDRTSERTAAEIVNGWDESDLADLFFYEGGEARSRRVARAIVEARRRAPFQRTGALADLIARTLGRGSAHIHPATKVFQALRRAVNEEGEELLASLAAAEEWLVDGGRLAVISFHSGEDGEVKRFLLEGVRAGRWELQSKKPVVASDAEVRANRRARSACLRAAIRTRHASPSSGGAP